MPRRPVAFFVALGLVVAACSSDPTVAPSGNETASTSSSTTSTTAATTTTTFPEWAVPGANVNWAEIPVSGPVAAVTTAEGIILPVTGGDANGWTVQTPCSNSGTVHGTPLYGANVVLDPGHGGEEHGATGPSTGLLEKDVNFAIALDAKALLEQAGATVVLTRTADYRITLATRGALAVALHPQAFVSIHHNAEPDEAWPGPGSETYYQIASGDSKRLAGLLWEEETSALKQYQIAWVADTDAGAKYRMSSDGGDYYGILRRTAGISAALSEAAFISNPPEEQLMATAAFQHVEAVAIVHAIVRFLGTPDPGSGFVTPYDRTFQSAGPGGSSAGCEDPALS